MGFYSAEQNRYKSTQKEMFELLISINSVLLRGSAEGFNRNTSFFPVPYFYWVNDGAIRGFLIADNQIDHDYIKAADYPAGVYTLAAFIDKDYRRAGIVGQLLNEAESWMSHQCQELRQVGAFLSQIEIPSNGKTAILNKQIGLMFIKQGYRAIQHDVFLKEFS